MLCLEKNNPNEPLHLFIIGGVGTCKNFMLMLLILLWFYNKHPQLDPSKNKALFMAYNCKATFNIDGNIIH